MAKKSKLTLDKDYAGDSKCIHLLITIDPDLLHCSFLYIRKGQLPVMYPLEALVDDKEHWRGKIFDGSKGGLVFPLKSDPVKVTYDVNAMAEFVREFLTKAREGVL